MSKLIRFGKSFQVVDGRRGEDYANEEGFNAIISVFSNNMDEWDELIECIFDEFSIPFNPIRFIAMGDRTSFLASANKAKNDIKITPCSAFKEGSITIALIHELGHIVTPTKIKATWNGARRDIHGVTFKNNTYRIAQLAFAVGLIEQYQVTYDIGMSYLTCEKKSENTPYTSGVGQNLRVGTLVEFEHSGHKWGGVWTGRVSKINRKTVKVISETKDGRPVSGSEWGIRNIGMLKILE